MFSIFLSPFCAHHFRITFYQHLAQAKGNEVGCQKTLLFYLEYGWTTPF